MADTHIIRTSRTANQKTNETNENSVYFLHCVHRFNDKARHWTNNTMEPRKVKIKYARDDNDNNNNNDKYYEGLSTPNERKQKCGRMKKRAVAHKRPSRVELIGSWVNKETSACYRWFRKAVNCFWKIKNRVS